MIIYLSSINNVYGLVDDDVLAETNGLLSYELANAKGESMIPKLKRFLCDSGAFSFMMKVVKNKKQKEIKWEEYIDKYCNFLLKHDVDLFFELDVDVCVGYEKVKEFRKRIIKNTGKLPIPVWHVSRGKEEFLRMCDEFPYVAFGGLMSDGFTSDEMAQVMPWFIEQAHKREAKIHGLGITNLNTLKTLHFDSVDSSTFVQSTVYARLNYWKDDTLLAFSESERGNKKKRIKNFTYMTRDEMMRHNFLEWKKAADYYEYTY